MFMQTKSRVCDKECTRITPGITENAPPATKRQYLGLSGFKNHALTNDHLNNLFIGASQKLNHPFPLQDMR